MSINRRSVTILSATGTEMNKYSTVVKGDSYYGYTDGFHTIQVINANDPAAGSEAYSFSGNFTFIRVYMDREQVGDGTTYDPSYGQISRVILSS